MSNTLFADDTLELDDIFVSTNVDTSRRVSGDIPANFVQRILMPYIPTDTDYLKKAKVLSVYNSKENGEPSIISAEGRFSIPTSCYIQSTGHFNAVEFLICFNQLAYTSLGHAVAEGILADLPEEFGSKSTRAKLKELSIEKFLDDQLSSMLILKTESRFESIIDANDFSAVLTIKSIFARYNTIFVNTHCKFTDSKDGRAEGTILLAYVSKSHASE